MKKLKGKHIALIVVGVILVILIALVGYGISTYNNLVGQQESISNAEGQIQNVLQRRSDLIPNLVNTDQGYVDHEEQAIQDVTDARAQMMQAGNTEEQLAADAQVTSALSRLFAIAENYPDLKANENFLSLQEELAGTENRIATERKRYNDAVTEYNRSIRRFPSSIIAGMFGFEQENYFEASEGATSNPVVDFGE